MLGVRRQFLIEIIGVNSLTSTFCFKAYCQQTSLILTEKHQIVRKVAIVAPRLPVAWSVPWQQGHAHLASPRKQISDGSEFCNAQTWFAGIF